MHEPSSQRWVLPATPCPPEGGGGSFAEVGLPRVAMEVLWNRGVRSEEQIGAFLEPDLGSLADPFLLAGMASAVDRLRRAVRESEPVFVFGDFDADGTAAAALAIGVLRGLAGARGEGGRERFGGGGAADDSTIRSISPERKEGFGLSERVVREVHERGGRLLLTVDCGTSANHAIGVARELGVDIVVADHHAPGDVVPSSAILVNPNLPGERYPFRDLAAVGVVHRLLDALTRESAESAAMLRHQLDLVALGTVADVVPLVGENRVLTWHGLRLMRESPRPVWLALAEACGLDPAWVSSIDIAYRLAPRLNAPGRLGSPARAIALLLAGEAEEARAIAADVENDNRERRDRHEKILKEVLLLVESVPRVAGDPIILGSEAWSAGVLGIVASRLVEIYRVPVVLVSLQGEIARGSARTPRGHDLLEWLGGVRDHLIQFGGHPQAAGVSMFPARFDAFRAALSRREAPARAAEALRHVDAELDPVACDLDLARALERLAPFGSGNEEPLFLGRCTVRRVRRERSRHLRFVAGDGNAAPDCIAFGMGRGGGEMPRAGARIDLLYLPVVNRHRGEERLQLKVRDFRLAENGGPPAATGNG
jgi:single-stranded-DNA-specific exonuclease